MLCASMCIQYTVYIYYCIIVCVKVLYVVIVCVHVCGACGTAHILHAAATSKTGALQLLQCIASN